MSSVLFSSWGGEVIGSSGPHAVPVEIEVLTFPAEFEKGRELKAFMGWDGIVFRNGSVNIVDMCREYMKKAQMESCGQCTPCREGTGWMHRVVHRIESGQGRPEDLDLLDDVANKIMGRTICALGDAAAMPVASFVKHFRDEFQYHIDHKKCMV